MKRSSIFAAVLGIMVLAICPVSAQVPFGDTTFEEMLLDDLGITEEHTAALGLVAMPVAERFEQRMLEIPGKIAAKIGVSLENAEQNVVDTETQLKVMSLIQMGIYENVMQMHDEMTVAAQEVFSDAQIQTFKERMFQVNYETWGPRYEFLENGVTYTDCTATNLMCGSLDVLGFTPEQKTQFLDIMSEANMEINRAAQEIETGFLEEIQALRDQLANAQTKEEREPLVKKLNELNWEKNRKVNEISQKVSKKINEKLDKILTDEQKAKKQKLFEQMPDYIWRARLENQDKERPWRPNIDSWRPGQGVPENLDNHPGETRPEKKQDGKKSFPTSEE